MRILEIRLKKARLKAGLKQIEVYKKSGVNNKTLSGYENGISMPDVEILSKLAGLYGVTVDWLLGIEEDSDRIEDDEFRQFIKDMEEKYDVQLMDDPIIIETFRGLIEAMARVRRQEVERLHA